MLPAQHCHPERSPARFCLAPGFSGRGTQSEGSALPFPELLQASAPPKPVGAKRLPLRRFTRSKCSVQQRLLVLRRFQSLVRDQPLSGRHTNSRARSAASFFRNINSALFLAHKCGEPIALNAPSRLQHKYIAARESHLKRKVDIQPHAAPGILGPASNLRATGNHAPFTKT
jgi:hypothetical protein